MRKLIILSSVLLFAVHFANAQNVSTEPSKKNVLLEDFTGIKCGNCPDGHVIVNRIHLSHPDNVFPIAVHAGYYATVSAADQPNFVTSEGEEINDYFGIDSYPSGMVNRREIGMSGKVQSRSNWTSSSRIITREDADVNVWVSSTYDQTTKILSTDVELYYINNVESSSSSLCVSLLQSGILGPQAGGDMEDEYEHNHVLRAMFTPTWGETIEASSAGTLVKKHYEYTVPEVIGNVETVPQNFDVVAYVINSDKEVMNVNGCKVDCEGMSLPTKVVLEAYKIASSRNYGFNNFECFLVNKGTEPITSAIFRFVIDDEDEVECTWVGADTEAVAGLERGYVRFPVEFPKSCIKSGCDYKLKLTGINGKSYNGNTIKGSFGAMINVTGKLKAVIKTDNFADDNTFRLLDADGDIVTEFGPYTEGKASTNEEILEFPEDGIYCFEITDAWGNGILSPRGNIKIYDENDALVLQNNEISYFGYRAFFNYAKTDGIREVKNNTSSEACYNLQGQRVTADARGIVIVNGKKQLIK